MLKFCNDCEKFDRIKVFYSGNGDWTCALYNNNKIVCTNLIVESFNSKVFSNVVFVKNGEIEDKNIELKLKPCDSCKRFLYYELFCSNELKG